MKVVIRLSKRAELQALPILLRHSPGMMLRDRTYIIDEKAARALHVAGVTFKLICRESINSARLGQRSGRAFE